MPYIEISARIERDTDIDNTAVATAMDNLADELNANVLWVYAEQNDGEE